MKSKTIILSDVNQNSTNSGRGILTIYLEDDLLKCKLRLYNLAKLTPQCKLGIYHQNNVFTANLIERSGQYESSFVGDFSMNEDFYCAIIDTANNNTPIIAGGTYAGYYFNDTSVFSPTQEIEPMEELDEIEENTAEILTDSSAINCEDCTKCANCKYKEFFYSNQPAPEIQAEQPTEVPPQEQPKEDKKVESAHPTIMDSITPQFKYIFDNYPQDETLNNLVPNSKFVQIAENGEQYSIGAIYEQNELKFISYAVKCENNITPPAELGEHYQWLPLDQEDPLSEGYYLVFQDANDLKILEL